MWAGRAIGVQLHIITNYSSILIASFIQLVLIITVYIFYLKKVDKIGLLVYWFICTIKQDILQIIVLYHVGSPVDKPPWVTAAAGSLANLEVILLQKSSSPFLVDIFRPLLPNQVPPQISTWLWFISSLPEQKSQLKSLYDCHTQNMVSALTDIYDWVAA